MNVIIGEAEKTVRETLIVSAVLVSVLFTAALFLFLKKRAMFSSRRKRLWRILLWISACDLCLAWCLVFLQNSFFYFLERTGFWFFLYIYFQTQHCLFSLCIYGEGCIPAAISDKAAVDTFMKVKHWKIASHIGTAIKYFALGIIAGLYVSDSGFRHPYLVIAALLLIGESISIGTQHKLENRLKSIKKEEMG